MDIVAAEVAVLVAVVVDDDDDFVAAGPAFGWNVEMRMELDSAAQFVAVVAAIAVDCLVETVDFVHNVLHWHYS